LFENNNQRLKVIKGGGKGEGKRDCQPNDDPDGKPDGPRDSHTDGQERRGRRGEKLT
jgi:hypothetical protein